MKRTTAHEWAITAARYRRWQIRGREQPPCTGTTVPTNKVRPHHASHTCLLPTGCEETIEPCRRSIDATRLYAHGTTGTNTSVSSPSRPDRTAPHRITARAVRIRSRRVARRDSAREAPRSSLPDPRRIPPRPSPGPRCLP